MEFRFGRDFSRIRVHSDASAADSASRLNSFAYTTGSDIYFASGKFRPGTIEGRSLLAHELAHVTQQDWAQNSECVPSRAGTVPGIFRKEGTPSPPADKEQTVVPGGITVSHGVSGQHSRGAADRLGKMSRLYP